MLLMVASICVVGTNICWGGSQCLYVGTNIC